MSLNAEFAQLPQNLNKLIKRGSHLYPEDIDRAEKYVYDRLIKSSFYDEDLRTKLICLALRGLIHDARHTSNRKIKRQAKAAFKSNTSKVRHNKVNVSKSKIILQMHKRWYDYNINGTRLGAIFGKDIPQIIVQEQSIADGHQANVKLLEALQPLVPMNQRIEDSVSAKKLNELARKYLKAA